MSIFCNIYRGCTHDVFLGVFENNAEMKINKNPGLPNFKNVTVFFKVFKK